MKFWLSLMFEPAESLLAHARNAEQLGFEGVVLPDHVVITDGARTPHPSGYPLDPKEIFVDPLLAFAAMSAVTTRLRFLNYIYLVPLRDPFMIAKQLGSLALLSNDRFVLGTGVGWLKEEFDTMGRDFSTRGKRLDEILTILRDFWDDGFAEFHGQFFDFPRSGMFPVPKQQIPIWVGGHSPAAARRAASYDGYMPMRVISNAHDQLDELSRTEFGLIDNLRKERGDTQQFERTIVATFLPTAEEGDRIAAATGITNLIVEPWTKSDYSKSVDEKMALAARFAEGSIRQR